MSILNDFLNGKTDGQSTNQESEKDRDQRLHERAKDHITEYNNELYYCEICSQVFVSFDVLHDHRQASEYDRARRSVECDGEKRGSRWAEYRVLESGSGFPDGAVVGAAEPCVPTEQHDDG